MSIGIISKLLEDRMSRISPRLFTVTNWGYNIDIRGPNMSIRIFFYEEYAKLRVIASQYDISGVFYTGKFLYADPAFPDNLVGVVSDTISHLLILSKP